MKRADRHWIRLGWAGLLLAGLGCGEPTSKAPTDGAVSEVTGSAITELATRSPSTERMAKRLALGVESLPARASLFMNRDRLEHLRQQPLPDDPTARAKAQLILAQETLRAGDSADAAAQFEAVLSGLEGDPELLSSSFEKRARELLAVSYLRLGEQENCLQHHTSASCLFPISEAGRHRRHEGSRKAMGVLEDVLRDDPDDLLSRWLFNLAAMTLGEYPDGVPPAWRIDPQVFASQAPMAAFEDVAPEVGLATVALAGGSVVDDLNGDGLLDVMVSSWGLRDPLRLLLAEPTDEGVLRYVDRTLEGGLEGLTGGLNLVPADVDNDGDLDVLVLRGAWMGRQGRVPNSLLLNRGDGTFDDVTEEVGLLSFHPTQTAAWGDFDNDGWLDLFIGNESSAGDQHPGQLYRNLGGEGSELIFEDVASQARVDAGGFIKGVALGDFDNDGWLDLYISRMRQSNSLFRNLGPNAAGDVVFAEVSSSAGIEEPVDSFATWFFDYDNDGWLDLFVADYATNFVDARASEAVADYLGHPVEGSKTRLYRNLGDGTFDDLSAEVGLDRQFLAMGANFGDLDNDGWLDLYLGTGAPDFSALIPNRMFRNAAGEGFQDVTTAGGFGHLQKGHGISFADLDHDGDQDVFAVMGGAFSGDVYANALFANPGNDNGWVTLLLEGTQANRSAIGARLRLQVIGPDGPREIFATVSTGGSFGASTLRQEIGLGDATVLEAVEVTWPGGSSEVFEDVPMQQQVRLRQGSGVADVVPHAVLRF